MVRRSASFRLLPPLSPAFRTRRLLALTLRDLRRLATGPIPQTPNDWEGRMYGRFAALPDQAQPLQRSQLMAAFSVGTEIIQLRHIASRFDLDAQPSMRRSTPSRKATAPSRSHVLLSSTRRSPLVPAPPQPSGARPASLQSPQALTQHAAYFDAGAPG